MGKLRIYGLWAGNPRGIKEDVTRCVSETYGRMRNNFIPYQCYRKRGYGPDGLFCKQHGKKVDEQRQRIEGEK